MSETDLQVTEGTELQGQETEMSSLLRMAVSQDLDTEKLEKLIDLKNREEERQCKKVFDDKFAEMQRQFEPVKKSKEGYGYNYAPLEHLQKQFGQTIADYGFSYRWKEQPLEDGGKRVILIISGWGYTDDSTTFDIPKLEGTKQQNAAQILGSMTTYGKRYTFMSGFGIIVEDEDDDAASLSFEDGVQFSNEIQQIRSASSLEELKEVFGMLYKSYSDSTAKKIFTTEKDKRKKELQDG